MPASNNRKATNRVSKVWMLTTGIETWAYFANSANSARKTERRNTARDGGEGVRLKK